ncbi:MAG: bifunctional (p)ppGpp synthetase/guanosine-3',5'-bis(diphosphate) 3'-pyrophosphohydrolase [Bacilli bacterium]|nr:bifunctional (p)ppGpp synthetase/guanosine-3',5'-bis(diphosphate) 3'-pyrophosphohydrolase [Bacilli bacterium]
MTKHKKITIDDLLDKLSYMNEEELKLINKSYDFASKVYFGSKRLTGDNYIDHPLNVAYILTDIKADADTISAALLHDVYEFDQNIDLSSFNKNICNLVNGVEKLKKLNFDISTESSIAMQRKILVGLTDDVRVIIIRLAEQLHDMRTLWVVSEEEQKRMANETTSVLTPIAHRLGMNKIKGELEDLSLRYSKPDVYFSIVDKLNQTKQERDKDVQEMIDAVSKILNDNGIKHQIKGRSKSIYSIYKKLDKGKKYSEIYDLLALRVFVEKETECYQALGLIHSAFKPMPKRFKDYIANPKTNMYQSLHTTVFGIYDNLYEIQIRTYEMDEVAERGIAAHFSYKEQGSNKLASKNEMESKLQFFRSIMELNSEETSDEEFVASVKEEFNSTIYVFTPRGDVIELPSGATPIDFAYKVHSGVGDKMVGAIVNNVMVPLDYELKNEDVVKINTNNNSKGPSLEWINMAKTAQAKGKIKSFFNKIDKEEYLKKGEDLLNKELHRKKIAYNEFFKDTNVEKLNKSLKMDLNEIYIAIGSSKLTPIAVINTIYNDGESKEDILLKKVSATNKNQNIKRDIVVDGIDEVKLKLASCCKPIPGDNIVGYITKGYGISVHRMSCPNLSDLNERLISVKWGDVENKKYSATLLIKTEKKDNILLEIISKASNNNINVESINTYNNDDDILFELTILVENTEVLDKYMSAVKSIPSCLSVERSMS